MQTEMLIALLSFCLVASITPGPINMMLLSSGATFGFRRTVPHILGISSGMVAMVLILGWTLAGAAHGVPALFPVLHVVSTIYLLWLAWRIATSSGPSKARASGKPLSLAGAAAFQWVNPKAWAMVLGAVASFARPDHLGLDVPVIALVLAAFGLPCITLWAGSGSALQGVLAHPRALRTFNIGMAALLVASILPSIWHEVARLA